MPNATFTRGILVPYDPTRGIVYDNEPAQKYLPVTFDSFFLDSVTGAIVSRTIFVNNPGQVTVEYVDGTSTSLYMNQGIQYVIKATRILSAGSTVPQSDIFWGY